jgi:ribosomal protein L1
MANRGKKYVEAREKVGRDKRYGLEDGVKLLLEAVYAKFDEGVDLAIRLGVDPKKPDQMVRPRSSPMEPAIGRVLAAKARKEAWTRG